jgi:sulfur carrier protein ThiS
VSYLATVLRTVRLTKVEVTETKTVAQLLHDLKLSPDHIVLIDGRRMMPDSIIHEHDNVIVLPLIAGG